MSLRGALAGGLAALLLTTGLALPVQASDCSADAVDLRWSGGAAHFNVEIADTEPERNRGLMYRESLARSAGMLFVYDHPQPASFWMHNTLIPLDILFFDAQGKLIVAYKNAQPMDETALPGGDSVKLVLEIGGGLSDRMGLTEDTVIRSPELDGSKAAWPCQP